MSFNLCSFKKISIRYTFDIFWEGLPHKKFQLNQELLKFKYHTNYENNNL